MVTAGMFPLLQLASFHRFVARMPFFPQGGVFSGWDGGPE